MGSELKGKHRKQMQAIDALLHDKLMTLGRRSLNSVGSLTGRMMNRAFWLVSPRISYRRY